MTGFTTRALNAGGVPDVLEKPMSVPIYQSATFAFEDLENFAAVSESKISGGYLYSRWANPTVEALARTVASIEGAEASACYASGMGTIAATLTALLQSGDHLVAARQLYGGAFGLIQGTLARNGITPTFVDITELSAVASAFTPETKVLYCETIGNPTLPVADLSALAVIARERGALFVVDGTFTPPCLLRPLSFGVDLVLHSATKYLGGHSDVTAGVVSGRRELIDQIRLRNLETGAVLAPMEAWLTLRGIQTLALRVERISASALALAQMLEQHPGVSRVFYPGVASHPQHALASKLLPDGFGGMLAVELSGGLDAGTKALQRVRVAHAAASLGSTHTLIVHPATVTHTQLTRQDRERAGITDGVLRISVGIEDTEDLLEDLQQALA